MDNLDLNFEAENPNPIEYKLGYNREFVQRNFSCDGCNKFDLELIYIELRQKLDFIEGYKQVDVLFLCRDCVRALMSEGITIEGLNSDV